MRAEWGGVRRKALRARRRDILSQFLVVSGLLGSVEGAAGIGAGVAPANAIGRRMDVPVSPSVGAALLALGFALVIALGFGLYPASRAARLDPMACCGRSERR